MAYPIAPVKRTRVPPLYENIMRWLATNPGASLKDGAEFFDVTPRWLSTVINSDLFITRYQEWMAELDNKVLLPTLLDRVKGAAALAVERLSESLESPAVDPDHALKATDVLLRAVKPPAPNIASATFNQQNVFTLDPRLAAVQAARRAQLEAAAALGSALPVTPMSEEVLSTGLLEIGETVEAVDIMPPPRNPNKVLDDF